ncbi:MAG: SGNH/GDSL hydrolase family protein [Acidobacteriota bacterium]|nr:SGNH/GDSL hydrolase family protein [Acidobacteriota bacterium]
MAKREKLKRFLRKLLMVFAGIFVGCLIAEIGLRIIGYSYPIFYIPDDYRGYAPIPDVEGWFWIETKNYVKINSEGFRDREHTKEKPADTVRIAVLGDSFAEARQVPIDQTFWAVMEQKLQGCAPFAGKKVEVLNFGVGGYGTVEELLTLRQRVWDYSPDIVLLTVTIYNDITDNYRPLKRADELPYFVYKNGQLVYDNSFRTSSKYRWHDSFLFRTWIWLHNHSRFLQLCHHAQFGIRTWLQNWRAQRRAAQSADLQRAAAQPPQQRTSADLAQEMGIENMVYREPDSNDWNEAWHVTEGLITEMRDEVRQKGAKFMVVTFSSDIQVYPNKVVRENFMKPLGVSDLFYPNRRLQALAEREGIPFMDLAQPMQAYADQNKVILHGFGKEIGNGHWNEAGHRLAGELISQRLCEGNLD